MKTISLLLSQPWVQQLGWTLIQFLWQGTVISILFAASRKFLGRTLSAHARYVLACGTLAAMITAPVLTFFLMPRLTHDVPPLTSWPFPSPDAWQPVLPWLVALWLGGVVVFSARLIGGWRVTVRLRSVGVRPAPSEWRQKLQELIARIGISMPVKLLVSSLVEVPTVVGWLRPVILMPVGALTGLPPEHAVALLAHELAHIRRLDYLVNIVQSIAEAVLFYHPAVWWVSGEIRAERELCCDDLAVAISGDVESYACALAELESNRPQLSSPALSANGGYLLNRIRRLIGQAPAFQTLPGPGAAAVMSLLWLIGIGAAAVHGAPTKPPIAPVVAASQPAAQTTAPAAPAALSLNPISSALLFGPYGPRTTVTAAAEPVAVQQPAAPVDNIGMEFVRIPAGSFLMGCSPDDGQCRDNEKPAHTVTITNAFELGKYLVTQGQYDAVMGTNPSHFKGDSNLPVEQVSWSTAQDFLKRMDARHDGYHYRLPTEAEWEYAARAGTEAIVAPLDAIAWYRENSGDSTHPVGQKRPNAWGLYDMVGNLAEWVQDKYGLYSAGALTDPAGPTRPFTIPVSSDAGMRSGRNLFTGDNHVLRGSSWGSSAKDTRMSVRSYVVPVDQRGSSIGFRVVRETVSYAPTTPANSFATEFVRIPAGSFMMGCSTGDSQCFDAEKPAHMVTITKAFDLGKYLVTQGQYYAATGTNPSLFKGDDNLPVEQVWDHAQDFLTRMNARKDGYHYRLPTEAEWEYAARAGTTGATYEPLDSIAWYYDNSRDKTHPVGQKQPNAWGLYDMIGNVWEWVKDNNGPYTASAVTDPEGEARSRIYLLRGGSWQSDARLARVSYRASAGPDDRTYVAGFRIVREVIP